METGLLGRPTFGGLASGLDTNALLQGLLEIERLPLNRIQSRRSEVAQQRSLMRDFNSKLLALRDAARELDNRNATGTDVSTTEEFLRYEGSSSNEDVITVRAGSGASPGDIDVLVQALAVGSRRFSESYSSSDAIALAEGQSITIDLPNAQPDAVPPVEATSITITAEAGEGGVTLQNLRDQINTSADNGGTVRADVLQISDDDFQLVLTSTGTGASNDITVSGDVPIDAARSVAATDATIEIFGQTISRESNFIDDVLTGVTLELKGPAETDDDDVPISETVTVGVDVDAVVEGLEKFTKAYNDVVGFIDRQFTYDETNNTSGPLSGDSTLRSVQVKLQQFVSRGFAFASNPNNPFAPNSDGALGGAISNIGIEIGGNGTLSLNKETLEEALALDPLSVAQFLSGTTRETPANQDEIDLNPSAVPDLYDEGFAQLVASELEEIVRSGDGTLAERDASFAKRLRSFDDSIDRFSERLGQREESLIQKFSALERIVSGLQSQQGFLSSLG